MNSIINDLNILRKEKNAIILAHMYQRPEVHDVADFVGDSLGLSKKVVTTDAEIIVFCGVHFMAETAYILNPNKKVLIPDISAGCPMADMITVKELNDFKAKFKNPFVIAYINTSAEIKAQSDICCTSSNAVNIVKHVDSTNKDVDIIFIPDRNLGYYAQKMSGVKMNIWNGFCPTHNNFILPEYILKARKEHPTAEILVHPECRPEVIEAADYAMSTGNMCKHVKHNANKDFIIGTETGILYKLRKKNPNKNFYPITDLSVCPNMKKTTIEKIFDVLKNTKNLVTVSNDIREKAYLPILKMLNISH
ncbi:MAG: quinolinate synthase NadA [Endomicrobium sp.]|jgi:quinolinate synthase|nr:quinolinate synthase NadA [Endomicrobium sp.]